MADPAPASGAPRADTGAPSPWAGRCLAGAVLLSLWVLFGPTQPGTPPFPGVDKVVHAALFALLAGTARWRFGTTAALLAVLAYAPLSEAVQAGLLPQRSGDPVDALADVAGAAAGWWAAGRRLGRRAA